ncbi:MAG: hydroxyacylglutathione hydrolase family protein, partial [Candidatus Caldarchaeum sp.]
MEIIEKEGFAILRFIAAQGDNNFQYIIWCKETREAAVIDPLDVRGILSCLEKHRLRVKYIINTHTHLDHTEGNDAILKVSLASFGEKHAARVIVHESALRKVAPRSEGVREGSTSTLGAIEIRVLHTPGHTHEHISLIAGNSLFCGDTLFVAGCGNVRYGGNIDDLYDTFSHKISTLPDGLEIYPGHDYGERNLGFTLDLIPENEDARG